MSDDEDIVQFKADLARANEQHVEFQKHIAQVKASVMPSPAKPVEVTTAAQALQSIQGVNEELLERLTAPLDVRQHQPESVPEQRLWQFVNELMEACGQRGNLQGTRLVANTQQMLAIVEDIERELQGRSASPTMQVDLTNEELIVQQQREISAWRSQMQHAAANIEAYQREQVKLQSLCRVLQGRQVTLVDLLRESNPAQRSDTENDELERVMLEHEQTKREKDDLEQQLRIAVEHLDQTTEHKRQFEDDMMKLNSTIMSKVSLMQQQKREFEERVVRDLNTSQIEHYESRVGQLEDAVMDKSNRLAEVKYESEMANKEMEAEISRLRSRLSREKAFPLRSPRLDLMYQHSYKGRGMGMLWECIQCVFEREYLIVTEDDAERIGAEEQFRTDFEERIVASLRSLQPGVTTVQTTQSLRELYIVHCNTKHCKPNSLVLQTLPSFPGATEAIKKLTELDFSRTLLGENGLQALLPILPLLPELQSLNLASNGLRTQSIQDFVEVVKDHPALTTIQLNNNRIGRTAGKALIRLLIANPRITTLDVQETNIEEPLQKRIKEKLSERKRLW